MSIEKFNPIISGETIPYFQANTHVVQNILDIEAGFIWIYLLTLPKDWIVVKEHIKKRYGLGDKKIKRIFAYLRICNLIEYVQERNINGKMCKSEIRILNGSRFQLSASTHIDTSVECTTGETHSHQEKPCQDNIFTGGSNTARAVNGTSGKEGTTYNINNINNKNNIFGSAAKSAAHKKSSVLTEITGKFEVTDKHRDIAKMFGIDIADEGAKFLDHFKANGKKMKNWSYAFNNWLRRAGEYKKQSYGYKNSYHKKQESGFASVESQSNSYKGNL